MPLGTGTAGPFACHTGERKDPERCAQQDIALLPGSAPACCPRALCGTVPVGNDAPCPSAGCLGIVSRLRGLD